PSTTMATTRSRTAFGSTCGWAEASTRLANTSQMTPKEIPSRSRFRTRSTSDFGAVCCRTAGSRVAPATSTSPAGARSHRVSTGERFSAVGAGAGGLRHELFGAVPAGDLDRSAGDRLVEHRRADHLAVDHHRDPGLGPLCSAGGELVEVRTVLAGHGQLQHVLLGAR